MTTQQIVNDLILDNQNLVIEELMKHDECLWDELENFDEDTHTIAIGGADRLPVKVSQWTM